MSKLKYIPATLGADEISLDGATAFVGTGNNIRSRRWARELGKSDLMSAGRYAREVTFNLVTDFETADSLREAADADVINRSPGMFQALGEWNQRGYILESNVSGVHFGWVTTSLTAAFLDGAWWRIKGISLLPPPSDPAGKQYQSATGEAVRTEGAAEEPLHALTIYGKSVQSGTPTPSSPIPVQVVEPPNLLRPYTTSGTDHSVTFEYKSDGSLVLSGTASSGNATYPYRAAAVSAGYPITLEPGTYTLSGNAPTGVTLLMSKSDGSGDLSGTFTLSVQTDAFFKATVLNGTALGTITIYAQLQRGSTAKPYVPYGCIGLECGGTKTAIDLQGNVLASLPDGTKDELTIDGTGAVTLVKRVGVVDLGTLDYSKSTAGTYARFISSQIASLVKPPTSSSTVSSVLSTGFRAESFDNAYAATSDNLIAITGADKSSAGNLNVVCGSYSDAAAFKNAMSGVKLYYGLKTPTTTTLTNIAMPTTYANGTVSITAAVTPTITAEWELAQHVNLDYPHDYPMYYSKPTTGGQVNTGSLVPRKPRIIFYGAVTDPQIIIAGNKYKVTGSVASGARIEIDGKEKTVKLIAQDGTVTDKFANALRGSGEGGGEYIFEPIPPGEHEITWDGTFGVDVDWYDEVGEPPWNLS